MHVLAQTHLPCNLCGSVRASVLSLKSRSGNPLRTLACRECGLVWSDPRPHEARRYYEDEYRLDYKRTSMPRPKHVLRAGKVALSRLAKIKSHLHGRLSVLDVGSGGGEFAYLLRTLGHEASGVEPNRGYASYAASEYGINVTRGFIDEVTLPEQGFDLITLWHVLEHTEDPGAVLRQLARALRADGLLVVEVPNVEATCQAPKSTFHEAHLYNFNRATLSALAARAGLALVRSTLSPDGGNITAVFRAALDAAVPPVALAGNHDFVAGVVCAHTPRRYWLSAHPYRRFARRMARTIGERMQTRSAVSGRELLDALYTQAQRSPRAEVQRRPLWPWVLGAYGVAALAECVLLDRYLPSIGWSEYHGVGLYAALVTLIAGGVALATNIPRSKGQFASFAMWTLPLFALPAVC